MMLNFFVVNNRIGETRGQHQVIVGASLLCCSVCTTKEKACVYVERITTMKLIMRARVKSISFGGSSFVILS